MKAKILIIGNELLYGSIADINGPFLAMWLDKLGFELTEIQILPDDPVSLETAIKSAWLNSDLVITTGGVGPTLDDITKSILAKSFNKKIHSCSKSALIVAQNYNNISKEWTSDLNDYDHIPKDFTATLNPKGLAPGLVFQDDSKMIMSAPGVPRELRAMATEVFTPMIKLKFSKLEKKKRIIIRTARLPEEKIFKDVCPNLWEDLSSFGTVSSLPQIIGVDIIITLSMNDEKTKHEKIINLISNSPLNEYVWHWGDESLEELIVKEATEKSLTFSFAESCTGGLTSSRITNISGSSAVFLGSLVTYSNDAKINILGVTQQTLKKFGAVSVETAHEMAKGVLDKIGPDLSVSFSGIAGPSGGTEDRPVGTLALAWGDHKHMNSEVFKFSGDREHLKLRFSEIGLFKLLNLIRNY